MGILTLKLWNERLPWNALLRCILYLWEIDHVRVGHRRCARPNAWTRWINHEVKDLMVAEILPCLRNVGVFFFTNQKIARCIRGVNATNEGRWLTR